jgi:predicted amidohydrolase
LFNASANGVAKVDPDMTDRHKTVRAAAIQMEARLADVPANIAQAADLAERALREGADIVALPEFFTTQVVLDERLYGCALPVKNDALTMMLSLARDYGAIIGGSYLEFDGGDVFNSYALVGPEGEVCRHRKDLPTMAESAFYIGGNDNGLVRLRDMDIGIAVCWETIRTRTANRLRARCDLIMSGSHWWSAPEWAFARGYFDHHARLNAEHMHRAPGRFARIVGAPLLHGAHCGVLEGRYALTARWSVPIRTHLVGETQIVDADGAIRARRQASEGAGYVMAEILTGRRRPDTPVPKTFWLEDLPPLVRAMWITQNHTCRKIYARARKSGKIRPSEPNTSASRQMPETDRLHEKAQIRNASMDDVK